MKGGMSDIVTLKMPNTLGFDFSGTVLKVGKAVTAHVSVGDEVHGMTLGLRSGSLATHVVVDARVVAAKPPSLTHNEAAALPLASITALQAFRSAGLKEGDSILISAGAGGVGSFAIQLAKSSLFKCKHVVTTASTEKEAYVKSLGADHSIDYRHKDFTQELADSLVDVALDSTKETAKMIRVVRPGGAVVSLLQHPTSDMLNQWLDTSTDGVEVSNALRVFARWAPRRMFDWVMGVPATSKSKVRFYHVMVVPTRQALEDISKLVESKEMCVHIDRVYSLENTREALEYLMTNRSKGKVIIQVK
jgi:NADPH:quinone reductase-like Zn-dependent oxidoreductase